jgi:hypothetical protein
MLFPAQAGIPNVKCANLQGIPACAGMTDFTTWDYCLRGKQHSAEPMTGFTTALRQFEMHPRKINLLKQPL